MGTKIYALAEPDGKIRYIGKTNCGLQHRFSRHLGDAKRGEKSHKCCWIRSLLTKGYIPKIIEIGEVEGDGCQEEVAWIQYFWDESVDLTNETDGGEGMCGHIASAETRKKLSLSRLGKHPSVETRKKLSIFFMGRNISAETRKKMSISQLGKHLSEETREKLSKVSKEQWANNAFRTSRMGHPCSEITRRKIADALRVYQQKSRHVTVKKA